MSFIDPQLAATLPEDFEVRPGEWVAEEKYDGHRLIVSVSTDLSGLTNTRQMRMSFEGGPTTPVKAVRAWSRNGLSRILPPHLTQQLGELPEGTYDGELLVPGKRSYGVTEVGNGPDLCFICFDVLTVLGKDLTGTSDYAAPYSVRRRMLGDIFSRAHFKDLLHVQLAWSLTLGSMDDARMLARQVWQKDGEGLILKRRSGLYYPGKRSKDFMKIKALRSAVLTIYGFESGKLGEWAKVRLKDEQNNLTVVKTRNTAERERLAANPEAALGRLLRITYQERTPDGSYRHPRWDRYEDE